jgi:hypothetical protein
MPVPERQAPITKQNGQVLTNGETNGDLQEDISDDFGSTSKSKAPPASEVC